MAFPSRSCCGAFLPRAKAPPPQWSRRSAQPSCRGQRPHRPSGLADAFAHPLLWPHRQWFPRPEPRAPAVQGFRPCCEAVVQWCPYRHQVIISELELRELLRKAVELENYVSLL